MFRKHSLWNNTKIGKMFPKTLHRTFWRNFLEAFSKTTEIVSESSGGRRFAPEWGKLCYCCLDILSYRLFRSSAVTRGFENVPKTFPRNIFWRVWTSSRNIHVTPHETLSRNIWETVSKTFRVCRNIGTHRLYSNLRIYQFIVDTGKW